MSNCLNNPGSAGLPACQSSDQAPSNFRSDLRSFKQPLSARLILLVTLLLLSCTIILKARNPGQTPPQNPVIPAQTPAPAQGEQAGNESSYGSITGKVVGEDGAIPFVNVTVTPASGRMRGNTFRSVTTDEAGNFKVDGLRHIAWIVSATAQGYVPESLPGAEDAEPPYHRIGDTVTIRLVKGGVITGRVINSRNEPVIAVRVSAQQVRDADGALLRSGGVTRELQTDDRGVYRLFGLAAGAYVVVAGSTSSAGGGPGGGPGGPGGGPGGRGRPSQYEGEVPTYYPSATRDTAVELTVRAGDELSGIDIQYRGETGHAVSGKILGAASGNPGGGGGGFGATSVTLTHTASGAVINRAFVISRPGPGGGNGSNSFALYGVPDGEYEIAAQRTAPGDQNDAASVPRHVTVVSRDVTGLDLTLMPMGTIVGKVQAERASAGSACQTKRKASIEELLFAVRREDGSSLEPARPGPGFGLRQRLSDNTRASSPDRTGELAWRQLMVGRYRIVPQLLDESWYLRAMTLPASTANATAKTAAKTAAPASTDAGRSGLMLKSGDRLSGLTIIVAEGAAGVKGKVTAAEGTKLPAHLRVHVIPAEKDAADNVLRYAETRTGSDRRFSFSNLAPGKYWLLAYPTAENEAADKQIRPKAWDSAERTKLRRDAETANQVIELQPCQRAVDYALRVQSR